MLYAPPTCNLDSLLIALDSGKSICYLCGDQISICPTVKFSWKILISDVINGAT